jgi:hypothetical protein
MHKKAYGDWVVRQVVGFSVLGEFLKADERQLLPSFCPVAMCILISDGDALQERVDKMLVLPYSEFFRIGMHDCICRVDTLALTPGSEHDAKGAVDPTIQDHRQAERQILFKLSVGYQESADNCGMALVVQERGMRSDQDTPKTNDQKRDEVLRRMLTRHTSRIKPRK